MIHSNIKKIIIVGCSGSGKSWLARQLADYTGLPLTHLDLEYWKPNWVKTPREEWIEKQQKFISKEQWIIEGNYNGTLELRFEAAQLVIFLDMNRFLCLVRVLKRHGKKRPDLPDYLEEKLIGSDFWDFCKWIWTFPKAGKRTILDLHQKYPDTPFIVLKTRKQVRLMLDQWQQGR